MIYAAGKISQPLRVIAAPHQLDDPIADPERLGVRDQIGGRGAGPQVAKSRH